MKFLTVWQVVPQGVLGPGHFDYDDPSLLHPSVIHANPDLTHLGGVSSAHDNLGHAQKKPSANYKFSYGVLDDKTGTAYTRKESADSKGTKGEYKVNLPDGRVQIVKYTADENGYRAKVSYEGEPQYDDHPPRPSARKFLKENEVVPVKSNYQPEIFSNLPLHAEREVVTINPEYQTELFSNFGKQDHHHDLHSIHDDFIHHPSTVPFHHPDHGHLHSPLHVPFTTPLHATHPSAHRVAPSPPPFSHHRALPTSPLHSFTPEPHSILGSPHPLHLNLHAGQHPIGPGVSPFPHFPSLRGHPFRGPLQRIAEVPIYRKDLKHKKRFQRSIKSDEFSTLKSTLLLE